MRADDAVALAGGCFESFSVQDVNAPVAARDQPVALEGPQDDGDGGTLHAEHDREEFLLEGEGIRMTGRVTVVILTYWRMRSYSARGTARLPPASSGA